MIACQRKNERERVRDANALAACRLSCGQSIYVIPFPLSSNCEQDVNRNSCWHLPQCAPASPARVLSDSMKEKRQRAESKVDGRTIHLNLCTSLCNNSAHSSDSSTCYELFRFLSSESVNSPIVIRLLGGSEGQGDRRLLPIPCKLFT